MTAEDTAEDLATAHGGGAPPPVSMAKPSENEPERAPNEGTLRETLVALRDEVERVPR